ncbi:MAG TPA: metalloregulator ArsR/SmtB family transcription factor [Candidatus Saccharimonadales bacterium]|nr:metalloregulator ArsR/SmtB family transcription factor [Candidatus Saccharimonadales bacterium]
MLSRKEHKKLQAHIRGMDVTRLAGAFDALGEPRRCTIFRNLLKKKEINVGDIASLLDISEPLASQHLKVLLNAELVQKIKKGKNVYYSVNREDKLVKALQKVVES